MAIKIQPAEFSNSVHELIRMALPQYELVFDPKEQIESGIVITCINLADRIRIIGSIDIEGNCLNDEQIYGLDPSKNDKQIKKLFRMFVYRFLCKFLGKNINAYGILTGMRPVKTVHRLLDQGLKGEMLIHKMEEEYLLEPDIAQLLCTIGINNRPYLLKPEEAYKLISVYIGIPFCPSRCYYCSFPGAIIENYETQILPFYQALQRELTVLGKYIQENNLKVQTIYIGGGTPTVLLEKELDGLFSLLHQYYISGYTREITVEAGRPDTLSPSNIKLLGTAGTNRICINPQSMRDKTLQAIGRQHTQSQVINTIEWVRKAGIEVINMDMILGLSGEDLQDNIYTGNKILELKPENITVHSLAVKRGSILAEQNGHKGMGSVEEVSQAIALLRDLFTDNSYSPYYLYRQKYMRANLENTAYSLAGYFCLYNIQVMEERQTILGIGGGAASKFVNPADWSLTSFHNPKDPASYCQTIESLIQRKVDKLQALN